jgi:hypothetical protein
MNKEDEFKQKSLKLLADPCKLIDIKYVPKDRDKLKDEIESKFKRKVSDNSYNYIIQEIEIIIMIETIIDDIINQASSNQNP